MAPVLRTVEISLNKTIAAIMQCGYNRTQALSLVIDVCYARLKEIEKKS